MPKLLANYFSINPVTETIFGNISTVTFVTAIVAPFSIAIGAIISFNDYYHYKELTKEIKGMESEVNYLEKRLKEEKDKLNTLKNEKPKNYNIPPVKSNESIKVDDKKQLQELKNKMELCVLCGEMEDTYKKYHAEGTLTDYLTERHYTNEEINFVENYYNNLTKDHNDEKGKLKLLIPKRRK